jgi:hypothetical protein
MLCNGFNLFLQVSERFNFLYSWFQSYQGNSQICPVHMVKYEVCHHVGNERHFKIGCVFVLLIISN